MKKLRFPLFFLASLLISVAAWSQGEKENLMRSNGRIYVVIAVIVTILAGLLLYVFRLDRKINKLERENP